MWFLQWDPPALEYVSADMVDSYFAPLGEFEPELKLPKEFESHSYVMTIPSTACCLMPDSTLF